MFEQMKFEMLAAALSTTASRAVKYVRDKASECLKESDLVHCDTPMKKAALTTAIGVTLSYVPYLSRYPLTQIAAQQFRIHGMMQAGDVLLDKLLKSKEEEKE